MPGTDKAACRLDDGLRERLAKLKVSYETEPAGHGAPRELREQVKAIERWYLYVWMALDVKIRTSIAEGISVFLSLFDQPEVAGVFCPRAARGGRRASHRHLPHRRRRGRGCTAQCRDSGGGCRRWRN